MMQSFFLLATYCIFGVYKVYASGLDQFWAHDIRAFEKIYGKTNDKDIFGATLLPPYINGDLTRDSSEKRDRYVFNDDVIGEPYTFDNSYKDLLTKYPFKNRKTPAFIGYSDFKPISKSNDPEAYNFLKHLDDADRAQRLFALRSGYKQYDVSGENPEDTDAYKSIQKILDAHESKRSKDRGDYRHSNKKRKQGGGYSYGPSNSKCPTGRCTQKIKSVRVRTGPYIKDGKK